METIKIHTGITNGRPQDVEGLRNAFKYFEGIPVDITIEKHKTKRSNQQNKYLWGVAWDLIAEFLNRPENKIASITFTPKDVHDHYVKRGYFGFKTSEIDGEQIPKGSSEATTIEFKEAIERLQKEYATRGLVIPDPGQTEFLEED